MLMLTPVQIARELHVSPALVRRWCRAGTLPALNEKAPDSKSGRDQWRISDTAFRQWKRDREKARHQPLPGLAPPERSLCLGDQTPGRVTPPDPPPAPAEAPVRILDLLRQIDARLARLEALWS